MVMANSTPATASNDCATVSPDVPHRNHVDPSLAVKTVAGDGGSNRSAL